VLALQLAKREGGVDIDVVATRVGVVGVVANNLVVAHEKLDTKGDVCCWAEEQGMFDKRLEPAVLDVCGIDADEAEYDVADEAFGVDVAVVDCSVARAPIDDALRTCERIIDVAQRRAMWWDAMARAIWRRCIRQKEKQQRQQQKEGGWAVGTKAAWA
jgi:hypothetical protein